MNLKIFMLEYVRQGFFLSFTSGYAPRGLKGHLCEEEGGSRHSLYNFSFEKKISRGNFSW